jgi:hypothetical protein
MYGSTCFWRSHAHHQKLNNCSSSLWFYRWSVVLAVLLVVVGQTGPTTTRCYPVDEQAHGLKKEEMIEQNVEANDRGPVGSTFFRFVPWTS